MAIKVGTVGMHYRDWVGTFYPSHTPVRRQLQLYTQSFEVSELTQFTHQMPDLSRITHFVHQLESVEKNNGSNKKHKTRFFVRIHQAFTHCADIGLALSIAKHFRNAFEPLHRSGRLAGFVATFPYAFKNSPESRDYIEQLQSALNFKDTPFQMDFRHSSWFQASCYEWMSRNNLSLVCVDEPALPGLVPPLVVSTSNRVLIRLHGRNEQSWWSGNTTTRHDYLYSTDELNEIYLRYEPLILDSELTNLGREVFFVFQNNWQAKAAQNALQWKELLLQNRAPSQRSCAPLSAPVVLDLADEEDDDNLRPPQSLSLAEVKLRVSQALSTETQILADTQASFELPLNASATELLE